MTIIENFIELKKFLINKFIYHAVPNSLVILNEYYTGTSKPNFQWISNTILTVLWIRITSVHEKK